MRISKQATREHLVVGSILVLLALACLIVNVWFGLAVLPFLVFFFGIWGGVELGRYLEHVLSSKNE